jgi:hypothetical protein
LKVLLLLGGEVFITMAIQDKVKNKIFTEINESPYNDGYLPNRTHRLYHRYGEISCDTDNNLAVLNDENHLYEERRKINRYWNISPDADGTTASPTIVLDYRWENTTLFIDISTYAVTIQLPNPSEVYIGFKIKFILSEASEGEATKNFGIITHDTGTDIQGYIGGGAAMNVTANSSSVYWDTSDAAASGGDWCEVITDGTGWYITGQAALANSIDIADGHDVTT